jgi:predicted dehydrogenase
MLQLGVIGYHQEEIYQLRKLQPLFEVNYIYDLNYPKFDLKEIKSTSKEVIDNSDCIYFTSILIYFDDACYAIKKGKPIFINNLLSLDIAQVNTLFRLSSEAESIIQLNSPLRFEKITQSISNNFRAPNLINLQRTFIDENHTNATLQEILFYEIENIISLIKAKVRKTYSFLIPEDGFEIETVDARLEFDNGCVTTLLISSIYDAPRHTLKLFNNKSLICLDFNENKIHLNNELEQETLKFEQLTAQTKQEEIFKAQLNNFYESITKNTLPAVSIEDGLQAIYITKEIIAKLVY